MPRPWGRGRLRTLGGPTGPSTYAATSGGHTHTLHYCLLCAWEFRFMKGDSRGQRQASCLGVHAAFEWRLLFAFKIDS